MRLRSHLASRPVECAALYLALCLFLPPPVAAQTPAPGWREEKCDIYKRAWSKLLAARGTKGLGPDFLAAQETFIASGCEERRVCPRSKEELDVANILTILAMNAGTASTFLPFACRR